MRGDASGDLAQARPRVSAVISVFNGAAYVRTAIECMLQQTFCDLEVIVINDGSSDATADVLCEFEGDARIRVITHDTNMGLVASLNEGIAAANGVLIARLDADDWCAPTRVERQVQVFDRDPQVVLCTTHFEVVDEAGSVRQLVRPFQSPGRLMMAMAAFNCIGHSTAMFRKDAALSVGGYRAEWMPGEDYDLWLRLLRVGSVGVVPSVEVRYLDNPSGISRREPSRQQDHGRRLAARWLRELAGDETKEQFASIESPFVTVRRWGLASRRLSRALEAKGESTGGVRLQALIGAMRVLHSRRFFVRHLLIVGLCPMLYVGGQVERLRLGRFQRVWWRRT